ncbi:MAG TPA: CYTH and CHAD domain-containing protein [Stellaceae bacterium]|jgi:inorganic triphosphatase YgiF
MANEVELKLEATGAAARRLLKAAWFRRMERAPIKRQHLVSVYYDTPGCALRDEGMSLRVRRVGARRLQTVKADPKGAAGPFGRHEWESQIAGPEPDLAFAKHTALDRFRLKKLRHRLRPVFETDVQRVAVPLRHRGSEIELAIDRGEVKTRRRRAPISEIEIELKAGDPAPAIDLARRIAKTVSVGYSAKAKAERGYALSAGETAAPVFDDTVVLDRDMTAGEAFKVIALSCLHHLAGNREAIAAGDREGVHQMRVGLRRLRAAMAFFKTLLPDAESARIRKNLKWLLGELGPARDLDVLIREGVEPLQQERADGAALAALDSDLKHRRRASLERAKAAIASDRYRATTLDTALWIAGGGWSRTSAPLIAGRRERRVADFAAEELARRDRKIVKRVKHLDKLDPHHRHKLRIAVKKLRYADEFFASLYDHGGARRCLKYHGQALQAMQSALGKLNDMQVHATMADAFVRSRRRAKQKPEKAFAMGLISGKDLARARALIATACAAGKEVSGLKPFWH